MGENMSRPAAHDRGAGSLRWVMPILFMARIALAVFLVMGAMVFYAAYAEAHTPHPGDTTPTEASKSIPHRA